MIVLIASFGFIEVDDAEASDIKKKTLKSGAVKTAGRTNTTANVNTLLHGIGAPSASLGINGDFFIDTLSMNIYGPKTKNAWPLPKSLIGPQGTAGAMGKSGTSGKDGRDGVNGKDGANGRDGDRGSLGASSSGSGSVGPQGPQGPQGPAGLSGPIGPTGPAGVAGAQGLPGAAGAPGTPGATGSPGIQGDTGPRGLQGLQGDAGAEGTAGATGPRGLQGLQGIQGDAGPRGLQGLQGDAGTTGAAGPSRLVHGTTLGLTLSTATSGTGITSEPVVTYKSNTRYSFLIRQFGEMPITQKGKYFGLDVFATNVTDLKYSTVVTESYSFRSRLSIHEYVFETIGSFSTTTNGGNLSFSVTDGGGVTGANPMTLSGLYQLLEIGNLSQIDQTIPVTEIL